MRHVMAFLFGGTGWVLIYSASLRVGLGALLILIAAKILFSESNESEPN